MRKLTDMTAGDEDIFPDGRAQASARRANVSALLWLATWLGIPFLVIVALYYAEPILQPQKPTEFVPTVTRQEVYPYPKGARGPSLAPLDPPRPTGLPFPAFPSSTPSAPPPSGTEIVAHPIYQPQPAYPQRALEQEREGSVRVRITIAADGSVSDAVVIAASPSGWFERAALDAVRTWRYQPPGRPLVTEALIEFKLD